MIRKYLEQFKRWRLRRRLMKLGIDPDRKLSRQEKRHMQRQLAKRLNKFA